MKVFACTLIVISGAHAFVSQLPASVAAATALGSTTASSTDLIPPPSVEDMMKEASATADMYENNVQKTYG
jgi:hypothetical protein